MSKEQIEELQKNPFFDKYASKIAKLQQWVAFSINSVENKHHKYKDVSNP